MCDIETDGYYVMNIVCVIIGVVTFWGFIKPAALKLQALPLRAWRIAEDAPQEVVCSGLTTDWLLEYQRKNQRFLAYFESPGLACAVIASVVYRTL